MSEKLKQYLEFIEDWERIVLTDAAGISSTLYAVKGEVNLDEYAMPPITASRIV